MTARNAAAIGGLALLSLAAVVLVQASLEHGSVGDKPLAALAVGGGLALAGGLLSSAPVLLVGAAALAGFPLWAIGDIAWHGLGSQAGSEHNMLPFEFLFYGFYMLLGVGVAWLGRQVRRGRRVAGDAAAGKDR